MLPVNPGRSKSVAPVQIYEVVSEIVNSNPLMQLNYNSTLTGGNKFRIISTTILFWLYLPRNVDPEIQSCNHLKVSDDDKFESVILLGKLTESS